MKTLAILALLLLSVTSVTATYDVQAETFSHIQCTDSDGGIMPFTPGNAHKIITVGDRCRRQEFSCNENEQEILNERYCKNGQIKTKEIDCADFGAICVENRHGPDACACPEGSQYDAQTKMCEDNEHEVPEFGSIAGALALSASGAAYLVIRKRK